MIDAPEDVDLGLDEGNSGLPEGLLLQNLDCKRLLRFLLCTFVNDGKAPSDNLQHPIRSWSLPSEFFSKSVIIAESHEVSRGIVRHWSCFFVFCGVIVLRECG